MRALVPVAIVAIVAVTFLVAWLTVHRRKGRGEQLRALLTENGRQRQVIQRVEDETVLQLAAGNTSHQFTADLVREHLRPTHTHPETTS